MYLLSSMRFIFGRRGQRMNAEETIYLWEKEKIPGYTPDVPQEPPHMVPFYPDNDRPYRGAVLVCPGGGYWMHYKPEGINVAKWLNNIGFAAFVLSYRYNPYLFPYPLIDAQRALKLMKFNSEKWGYSRRPVGIIGSSAGGHIAGMTGIFHNEKFIEMNEDHIDCLNSKPDFMILCYPVITFGEYGNVSCRIKLLGEKSSEELRRKLSLENSVTSETSPAFIWQTQNDEQVSIENSFMMANALKNNKVPISFHVFPEGKHGLGVTNQRPDVHKWTSLCDDWLKSQGF